MADQFSRMYDVERVGGDQRTRLAEMLRAAGQNAPQGQMVSGWYVPPSWSQNLNTALSGALGTYMGVKLDQEQKEKVADFLKRYEQGKEMPQEPVMQNFNRIEGAEGQTPFANQPAQTELQRITGRQSIQAEGQTPAAQAMTQPRQAQPQYRPWTSQEKENMLMEAYQIDPRIAGILGSRYDREVSREEAKALKQEERAWKTAEAEKQREFLAGEHALTRAVTLSGRTPASEKPLTEYQGKAVTFGTRAAQSHNILNALEADVSPTAVMASRKGGMAVNWALDPKTRQVEQAQRDFINAVLRQESGAAIGQNEYDSAARQYFPEPNDPPELVAQKRASREAQIRGFTRQAGAAGAPDIINAFNTSYALPQTQEKTAPRGRLGTQSTMPPNTQVKFLGFEK